MENVGYRHAYRRDIDVRRRQHDLKDQQQKIQLKTFTNWINHTLKRNGSKRRVNNLLEEIKDGVILLEVIQILTKEKVTKGRSSSTTRPLQINNVSTALDFLSTKGIRLVNINCSDIVDGKPAIVLGLIWKIILHLQIQNTLDPGGYNITGLFDYFTGRNTVLDAKDFGRSWRNGVLFGKLINTIKPGLVDTEIMVKENHQQNLQMAFNIAEEKLDIPRLLDPEDIDVDKPDEVSIITYVGEFIKKYPQGVDGKLKKTLLTRAERLGGAVDQDVVDRNSNITSYHRQQPGETNIFLYSLTLFLVFLFRYIWIFVVIALLLYELNKRL